MPSSALQGHERTPSRCQRQKRLLIVSSGPAPGQRVGELVEGYQD